MLFGQLPGAVGEVVVDALEGLGEGGAVDVDAATDDLDAVAGQADDALDVFGAGRERALQDRDVVARDVADAVADPVDEQAIPVVMLGCIDEPRTSEN